MSIPKYRYIFLDVDGVLNSREQTTALYQQYEDFEREDIPKEIREQMLHGMYPEYVERLNCITDQTGAVLVISASMRKLHPLSSLKDIFASMGVRASVVDKTSSDRHGQRGEEIKAWLKQHKHTIQSFVILDDETTDMGDVVDCVVKTSYYGSDGGLQDHHVQEAIKRLQGDEHTWPI